MFIKFYKFMYLQKVWEISRTQIRKSSQNLKIVCECEKVHEFRKIMHFKENNIRNEQRKMRKRAERT